MKNGCMLLTLYCLLTVRSAAQSTEACDQLLKVVFDHTTELNRNPNNRMCFIEYGVKTIERNPSQPAVESKVQLYTDQHNRYIFTDQAKFYIDSNYAISVVPASKMILVNAMDDKTKGAVKKMGNVMQDSLLGTSPQVLSCKDVAGNSHYDKEIEIKPPKASSQIVKVKYCINTTQKTIYKIVVLYAKASKYSTTEYTFYKSDYNYTEKKIDQPVYSLFFKTDGSLLSSYKGYKVIDKGIQTQPTTK
ncbi:MAG: hypothetical protein JWO58_3118 [Chitinophagaceae bacterium]|nr:hypothetical protein [Chitinophagaceae bacterium]